MTPEEERDVLDGRLRWRWLEFDDMLLEQQQALEEKQREDPVPGREDAGRRVEAVAPGSRPPAVAAAGSSGGRGAEAGARGGGQYG